MFERIQFFGIPKKSTEGHSKLSQHISHSRSVSGLAKRTGAGVAAVFRFSHIALNNMESQPKFLRRLFDCASPFSANYQNRIQKEEPNNFSFQKLEIDYQNIG